VPRHAPSTPSRFTLLIGAFWCGPLHRRPSAGPPRWVSGGRARLATVPTFPTCIADRWLARGVVGYSERCRPARQHGSLCSLKQLTRHRANEAQYSAARAHLSGSKSLSLSELCSPTWSNDMGLPSQHDSLARTNCQGEAAGSISTSRARLRIVFLSFLTGKCLVTLSCTSPSSIPALFQTSPTEPRITHLRNSGSLLSGLLSGPYLYIPLVFISCRHCSLVVCLVPKCLEGDARYSR
jgi:hypothetical protein